MQTMSKKGKSFFDLLLLSPLCTTAHQKRLADKQQVEDFHPRKSIVVTPDKMAAFYENHTVEGEVFQLIRKK